MEGFSLEDDDMNSMFITQKVCKSSQNGLNQVKSDEDSFGIATANEDQGGAEVAAIPDYSDISDDDGVWGT